MSTSKPRTYSGDAIEITFDMARCIHARNCFLKLPDVFDPARRPSVDPNAASADEISAMVRTCPSGALTYKRRDGVADEAPPKLNRVAVLENGPLALQGDLSIGGENQTRATLCRCGQTKNPPYCDYSHVEAGFEATGEPKPDAKEAEIEVGAGLVVAGREDGPLLVKGPMEITTGTGARIAQAEMAPLCRCGLSANKPYCDGSHREGGFKVPEA
ncbi:MAG: CDGSH iron-sulfur domain-containing protein [Pseudomonadota bacterium]